MKNLFLTFFLLTFSLIHSQWKYKRIEIDYEKKKVAYASSNIEQHPVFIFFYDSNTIMVGIEGYYNSPRFAFNFTSKDGKIQKTTSKSGVRESLPKVDFKNFLKITGNGYNFYKVKGNIQSLIPDLKKFHSIKLEITSKYTYSRNIPLSGSSAAINYVLGIKSSIQTKNIRSRTTLYEFQGRQFTFDQVKRSAEGANLPFVAYISKHGIKEWNPFAKQFVPYDISKSQQKDVEPIKSKKDDSVKTKNIVSSDDTLLWVIISFSTIIIALLVLLTKKNNASIQKDIYKRSSPKMDSNSKKNNLSKIESNNKSLIDKDQLSYCVNCGGKLDQSNEFCVKCGNKVEKIQKT